MNANALTLEEAIAQLLCWWIRDESPDDIRRILDQVPVGAVLSNVLTSERNQEVVSAITGATRIPIIRSADLVNGAGSIVSEATRFPFQMAVGATDSEELAEQMGHATAVEGRGLGFQWTFAPVVDLNMNFRNPLVNNRAFGEDPDHVLRLSRAFIRGVQRDGLMAACPKHFPGDGVDDRDQHLCTSQNTLTETEWMATFGRVWQGVIDAGAMTVMMGHIGLSWCDPGDGSYLGAPPATLSRPIQIGLLRERLGFTGVIISDAMPMIGICAHAPEAERAVRNIQTGSDMVLFAKPQSDFDHLLKAVQAGHIPEAQIYASAQRILDLKTKLHLWDDAPVIRRDNETSAVFQAAAQQIAERAITIVRDAHTQIPQRLAPGARVLTVSNQYTNANRDGCDLDIIDEELRLRGLEVDHLENPGAHELMEAAGQYDFVFFNIRIYPNSAPFGTLRFSGNQAFMFWRAFWVEHPHVIFTSFGDPYKLWELPSVPNMINAYDASSVTQRAIVKVWLGEIAAQGKSPVQLPGFFECKV